MHVQNVEMGIISIKIHVKVDARMACMGIVGSVNCVILHVEVVKVRAVMNV